VWEICIILRKEPRFTKAKSVIAQKNIIQPKS